MFPCDATVFIPTVPSRGRVPPVYCHVVPTPERQTTRLPAAAKDRAGPPPGGTGDAAGAPTTLASQWQISLMASSGTTRSPG